MNATKQALAAWAGMIGSALFVAVFALEDFLRPDFNWLRTPDFSAKDSDDGRGRDRSIAAPQANQSTDRVIKRTRV
jgi:hypothetical protein